MARTVLPLLVLLLAVAGGAWLLLGQGPEGAPAEEGVEVPERSPRASRADAPPPLPPEIEAPAVPRVAATAPEERWSRLEEPSGWRERELVVDAEPGEGRGADLLDAMGEVAYVRVQDAALLAELERTPLEDLPPDPLFLETALMWWRDRGYRTDLRYPVVVIGRAP